MRASGTASSMSFQCAQHRRQRDLAFHAREREAQADVHAEAERQVRRAAARELQPVGLLVGLRVAVGRVQHQEHAVARLEALAAQLLLHLHDAHLRAARTVVAQQLLDGARREFRILAQRMQLAWGNAAATAGRWRCGWWWSRGRRTAAGCRWRRARPRSGGRRRRPGAPAGRAGPRSAFLCSVLDQFAGKRRPFPASRSRRCRTSPADMRELPMNSAMSSDMRFTFASSSRGTPSIAMITSAGSGPAKSAMKSISSRAPMRSSSHRVSVFGRRAAWRSSTAGGTPCSSGAAGACAPAGRGTPSSASGSG